MLLTVLAALAGTPPAACPSLTTDPPACPAGSLLGASVDTPLEWGPAADGMQPWWGRISCADGRIPVIKRHGGVGTPETPSQSTPSGQPTFGGGDVVDAWEIGCPSGHQVLYTNLYRCGNACVPTTLSVLPAAAYPHLDGAQRALKSGNKDLAISEARAATDAAAAFERVWVFRGGVAEDAARWDEALSVWTEAVKRFPGPVSESHRAEALARSGKKDEAKALAASLLAATPDAPTRPRLLCVQSLIADTPAKAKVLAEQSCAEGYRRCCAP